MYNVGNQRLATLDDPHRPILSRVRCIALFADGRIVNPVVLYGQLSSESLHTGGNHWCVPFRPCEGDQSIFVAPSGDHGIRVGRPSSRHPNLARKIAGRSRDCVDGQGSKPGLKSGTGRWINLDTKDAKNHGWLANYILYRNFLSNTLQSNDRWKLWAYSPILLQSLELFPISYPRAY